MKRRVQKWMALLLTSVFLFSCLAPAGAASDVRTVSAQLRPDFTIVIDGSQRIFYTAGGEQVFPVLYDGTTYLPLRAVGELMGRQVNWDEATKTISLYGSRTDRTTGTRSDQTYPVTISATLRGDFTLVVDGVKQSFTDGRGYALWPLLYDGTTYLPLRAVGQLMGRSVDWNSSTNTVTMGQAAGDGLVTDADSFNEASKRVDEARAGLSTNETISKAKAREVALDHAGVRTSEATFTKTMLEKSDGIWQYDVEFYTAKRSYDYNIGAVTGNVLSAKSSAVNTPSGDYIGEAKAREIALDHSNVKKSAATFTKTKLERDDGVWEYDVKFYTTDRQYDYEIKATDGTVLKAESEKRLQSTDGEIGEAKAKEIALEKAGLTAGSVAFTKVKLDLDDGRKEYDIEFYSGDKEYEFEIDAATGLILDWDMESRDDD